MMVILPIDYFKFRQNLLLTELACLVMFQVPSVSHASRGIPAIPLELHITIFLQDCKFAHPFVVCGGMVFESNTIASHYLVDALITRHMVIRSDVNATYLRSADSYISYTSAYKFEG
jgi:hypothetical protein